MQYYDIIPLTKVARNKSQFFTYSNDSALSIGDLVQINFGRKKLNGIVLKEVKKPLFKTRKIAAIIQEKFLSEKQILLAKHISVYYLSALGLSTKQFIPKFAKKETPCFIESSKVQVKKIHPTKEQLEIIEKISKTDQKPFLLFGPSSSGKTEVLMNAMEAVLQKKKQCLLVIPDIFLSTQEIKRYKERFPNYNLLFFHSKLKSTETTFALNSVRDGSADIIISTRMGMFLPFKNLGLIALDEEQDISHKQWDTSPRYHARTVAEMMTRIYKTRTIFCSGTPSLESVQKALDKKYTLLELPPLKVEIDDTLAEVKKPTFVIPDLRTVYGKKGSVPFSEELREELTKTLQEKQLSLVLVPRRGKSKAVYCSDCKKTLRCPSCDLPLLHEKEFYRCLHCSFKSSSLSQCPNCRSFRLKDIGFGTEGVAKFLEKNYPSANIEVADSTTLDTIATRKKLFSKISKQEIDILVGTYTIAKGFDIPHVKLVSVVNVDNWAGQTDFRFDERWLSNLFQLSGRLNRIGSNHQGTCIIQAYDPENELLTYLKDWDWLTFAKEELETREAFSYPPFAFVIRLTYKNIKEEVVVKNTKMVYGKLLNIFRNSKTSVQAPYFGTIKKVRNKWEKHILLKTTTFTSENWKTISMIVPDDWIIDVDSETIF